MKRILIIGAGFLQTYVIKKAKELGYYVLAVDGNPNAPGFTFADEYAAVNIVDEQACLDYAREKKINGVLTAATDYGVLSAARIAEELGLNGLSYAAAKRIKNKFDVRNCLYAAHADDSGLSYEVSDEQSIENAAKSVTFPVMVKPCDGSGSRGASRVDRAEDFAEACRFATSQSLTGKATVESFVEGKEYGVESFVYNGKIHVLGIMQKRMTKPPYYAELGHALPSNLPKETEAKIKRCVRAAIDALQINFGSVNMDILLTESGSVHIVDIGARMGGNLIGSHIIPLATGITYIESMVKAAVGDEADFTPFAAPQAVATSLLALTPGNIQALPDLEKIAKEFGITLEHHLAVGDTIHEYHTNLDGCGYVICTAGSVGEAERIAEQTRLEIDKKIVRG